MHYYAHSTEQLSYCTSVLDLITYIQTDIQRILLIIIGTLYAVWFCFNQSFFAVIFFGGFSSLSVTALCFLTGTSFLPSVRPSVLDPHSFLPSFLHQWRKHDRLVFFTPFCGNNKKNTTIVTNGKSASAHWVSLAHSCDNDTKNEEA